METTEKLGIRYVGHPFVDVGVAALKAATGVERVEELTQEQIKPFLDWLADIYINPMMSNYLGAVVFSNANFANPAMNTKPQYDEARRAKLNEWLHLREMESLPSHMEPADEDEQCVFSGDPAIVRVSRMVIPMIGSETAINFVPQGRPRLPIADWVIMALLAMPMGTVNSGGRVLLVHSYDTYLMEVLAARNLKRNRDDIHKADQSDWIRKRPNYKFYRTFLLHELNDLYVKEARTPTYPLTVYHFTSSGQASDMNIYHLSSTIIRFIHRAYHETPDAWKRLLNRAWDTGEDEKEARSQGQVEVRIRNYLYEDLFRLNSPQDKRRFLRRYFLRRRLPRKKTDKTDPRRGYSLIQERELISWDLLAIYLEVVMNISQERYETIKELGTRLARFIEIEPKYYNKLYQARDGRSVRRVMVQAANRVRQLGVSGDVDLDGSELALRPLITLDEFKDAFMTEDGEGFREDWWLAQDLLLIRIIEQLSPQFIERNVDMLQEAEENTEGDE